MYANQLLADLGQAGVNSAVTAAIAPFMPALQQAMMSIAEPAAKKAAEVAKPALKEALSDYAPTAIALGALLFGAGIFTAFAVVNKWRKENL